MKRMISIIALLPIMPKMSRNVARIKNEQIVKIPKRLNFFMFMIKKSAMGAIVNAT